MHTCNCYYWSHYDSQIWHESLLKQCANTVISIAVGNFSPALRFSVLLLCCWGDGGARWERLQVWAPLHLSKTTNPKLLLKVALCKAASATGEWMGECEPYIVKRFDCSLEWSSGKRSPFHYSCVTHNVLCNTTLPHTHTHIHMNNLPHKSLCHQPVGQWKMLTVMICCGSGPLWENEAHFCLTLCDAWLKTKKKRDLKIKVEFLAFGTVVDVYVLEKLNYVHSTYSSISLLSLSENCEPCDWLFNKPGYHLFFKLLK